MRHTTDPGTPPPVIVFKIASNLIQHGVLGAVRSLGRLGSPVTYVHAEQAPIVAQSRFVSRTTGLPPGVTDEQVWVERLREESERLQSPPVLLPADDAGVRLLDTHRQSLGAVAHFAESPPGMVVKVTDKHRLHAIAQDCGVPTPASELAGADELRQRASHRATPVVVKRVARSSRLEQSVEVVTDSTRLREIADALDEAGEQVLLQEYVAPSSSSEWLYNAYVARDGTVLGAATGRKLLQYRPGIGMACLGVVQRNPEIVRSAERLLSVTGLRGPVDIDFRRDPATGQFKVLDVNPRLGASFRMFAAPDGMDVARAAVLDLAGLPVPATTGPAEGRRWLVEHHYLYSSLQLVRSRRRFPGAWPVHEAAWTARDDLRPALALAAHSLGRRRRAGTRRHPPEPVASA